MRVGVSQEQDATPWSSGFSWFGLRVADQSVDRPAGPIEPHLNVFDRRDVATSPDPGAGPTREQPRGATPPFASDRKCLEIGDRRQHARAIEAREPVSAADRRPVDHDLGNTLFPWFTNPKGPPVYNEIWMHVIFGLVLVPFFIGAIRSAGDIESRGSRAL